MQAMVIKEENYFEFMENTAVPYLLERKTEHSLESRDGEKKLFYVKYMADAPKGVVVISHGFTETAEKYQEIIYYFLKEQYHVYISEHCGHGNSYRMSEDLSLVHVDSFKRYINDILTVANIAKKENKELPMFLYAHSMGGGVAAALLSKEKKLFKKAVLSSPMIRPQTGNVPWHAAKMVAVFFCRTGKSKEYVLGGHPFDGKETFEDSASSCFERFEFYQRRRNSEVLYQMSSPSYGWLRAAAELEKYLLKEAWQRIETPIIVFQAENDAFVCPEQQSQFVLKINRAGNTQAELIKVPGTKHEIFNSSSEVLEGYWEKIFSFFEDMQR